MRDLVNIFTGPVRRQFFRIALFLYYPFLVFVVLGFFLTPYLKDYLKEIIAFGILTFIFLTVFFLFNQKPIQKYLLYIFSFVLAFFAFVKLAFYYNFNAKLSSSAFFVMFETNSQETIEFLTNYADKEVVGILMLLLLPIIIMGISKFLKSSFFDLKRMPRWTLQLRIVSFVAITISIFVIKWKFLNENILYATVESYRQYVQTKEVLKGALGANNSENISRVSYTEDPQTYVVIIGESTSNWHMQLYGYDRETNPLLSEIENELVVFKNTITPHVHTIMAFDKIFTLNDYNNPKTAKNFSVVQLANHAKYKTYWLSNQRPSGLHESIPSLVGKAADKTYFANLRDYTSLVFDENLFPLIDEVLLEKDKKKMIFIHLMGTHTSYFNRYPNEFDVFYGENPKSQYHYKKAVDLTNGYDNAIRYNDFVVRTIIEKVKKQQSNSYVLYFSDHGEEVFDTMDFCGHNEYDISEPMYEIPFIMWMSEKYKKDHPEFVKTDSLENRKYILEDFIHTFSDLSDIKFGEFEPKKSIVNPKFQEKTRWIKENVNYDKKN